MGNIILVGCMGSGKTTLGRLLAAQTGRAYVDTDCLVVELAGQTIPELFAQGEDIFRQWESQALITALRHSNQVIATGGGIIIAAGNRRRLHQAAAAGDTVVYLRAEPDELYKRVGHDTKRPLLQTENPRQALADLVQKRDRWYQDVAELVVDTTDHTPAKLVHQILCWAKLTPLERQEP